MVMGPGQSGVLHHKFDIDDTARILLDVKGHTRVEGVGCGAGHSGLRAQAGAHLGAHFTHFDTQLLKVARLPQHLRPHLLERLANPRATHQHARADQCLVLPGPGLALLVAFECAQRADQQARGTRGPQTHVHVIQLARVGLGGQQVNDALPQPREELRTVDGLGTVGFGLRVAIVDEHQVQVRPMARFKATDLAIADDDESRVAGDAVTAHGLTVAGNGLAPGQGKHLVEDGLGQPRQVVADFHQRQVATDFRGRHAQAVRQLEVTQRLHLLLQIILWYAREALAQFAGQLRCQWRAEQAAFIEQLIEQQGVACDLLGNPWAGGAQGQQTAQGTGVLGEQDQVGRAPGHGFDQRQYPLEHQVGVLVLDRLGQQSRDEGVQPLAPKALHRT